MMVSYCPEIKPRDIAELSDLCSCTDLKKKVDIDTYYYRSTRAQDMKGKK